MSEKRVLPAKVYDALLLSAAMYGGIGGESWVQGRTDWRLGWDARDQYAPNCYVGHLYCAGFQEAAEPHDPNQAGTRAFGVSYIDSDEAVERINRRKRAAAAARVTFEEWCAELNVVRGDETPSPARGSADAESDAAPDSRALVSR